MRLTIIHHAKKILRTDDGATAIEYALIASLISVAVAAAINHMGSQMNAMYATIGAALSSAL